MVIRATMSIVIAIVIGFCTIVLWQVLANSNERQIARIAEAESYAARSQLIRNVDTMLTAMRNVRSFWSAFGPLAPRPVGIGCRG